MNPRNFLSFFALGALMQAPLVAADEADVFNINASYTSARDSNFFRLAPSVEHTTLGLAKRSEVISSTGVGLNIDKTFGVQRIIGNVGLVDNRYTNNKYLDYREFNYDAKWLWALGVQLTGEAALDRKESLNSYADNRITNLNAQSQSRDLRVTNNERFTAYYWFHSSWATLAGVSRTQQTNEKIGLAESDYEASGYNVGLRFRPASGNTLIGRLRTLKGSYDNRPFDPVARFDKGFTQESAELDVDWRLSGESQLRSHLEFRRRQHDNFKDRNYSGGAGNVDYIYAFSGKARLTLGYKRGLESFQEAGSSYYVLDEASLAAQWTPASKLNLQAKVASGQRSYLGAVVPLAVGVEPREDQIERLEFNIAYQFARWIELRAGYTEEHRKTNNNPLLDYNDNVGYVSVATQF